MQLVMLNKSIEILRAGTILRVIEDTGKGLYVAIDGPMSGHTFLKSDCERLYTQREFLDIQKELLTLRDIVAEMVINKEFQKQVLERIEVDIQAIYEKWTSSPTLGDDKEDGADLAERITKFVTEELKL